MSLSILDNIEGQRLPTFGLAPRFLAPDNWVVWRVGEALILSGGDGTHSLQPAAGNAVAPFGTLYAAYEFLERLTGVRWYWPGELGRQTPRQTDLIVKKAQWSGAPAYDARFCFYEVHDDPDFTLDDVYTWWQRMRRGGTGGSPIGMHSFNDWPNRFGKTRPDYFALQRDGTRMTDPHELGGHVCHSNPDVLRETVAEKRREFGTWPWMKYRPVMPGDGMGNHVCQCRECQATIRPTEGGGEYSHLVWDFVNRVAAEVRQSHPDRFITCCAYGEYSKVPAELALERNIAVTLTIGSASMNVAHGPQQQA